MGAVKIDDAFLPSNVLAIRSASRGIESPNTTGMSMPIVKSSLSLKDSTN